MEILSMNVVVSAIVDPWVTTLSFVVALAMKIQDQNKSLHTKKGQLAPKWCVTKLCPIKFRASNKLPTKQRLSHSTKNCLLNKLPPISSVLGNRRQLKS